MSRLFAESGPRLYQAGTSPYLVSDLPLAFSCWVNKSVSSAADTIVGITRFSVAAVNLTSIDFQFPLAAEITLNDDSSNVLQAVSRNTVSVGEWAHAYGCLRNTDSAIAVLNGDWAQRGEQSFSSIGTVSAFDRFTIGGRINTLGTHAALNGLLAHLAIWRAELTRAEIQALARGVSPLLIKPAALDYYMPFDSRGNLRDYVRGFTVTESSPNPPILDPSNPRMHYGRRRSAARVLVPRIAWTRGS